MAGQRFARPESRPLGRPGERPQGFRRTRRGAHYRQECSETPKRPARRQPPLALRALPRQTAVGHARASQPQLCVGGEHEPAPEVGLLGVPNPRRGPPERLLEETDSVLQVETPHVCPPQEIQIRLPVSGEPEPELLRLAALPRKLANLDQDHGAPHDGRRLASVASVWKSTTPRAPGPAAV
jgi:hypothetical protein